MALASSGIGVDNVYVTINQPQPILTNAQDTYNMGLVGCAGWGPMNTPVLVNTTQQLISTWGNPIGSGHDIVQDGALFLKQSPMGGVYASRVGDGTQAAAASTGFVDSGAAVGAVLTAFYTGAVGNSIVSTLGVGSNSLTGALTWKVTNSCAQLGIYEVIDNIPGETEAPAWAAIISAINAKSVLVVATAGSPSALPSATTQTAPAYAGGLNGTTSISTAVLVGADGSAGSRTGLYSLRSTGCDCVMLSGCTDSASWSTLDAFAKSEVMFALGGMTASFTVQQAINAKLTAGVADYDLVLCYGSVTYLDTFLGTNVTLPSCSVIGGVIESVDPQDSPGNNVCYGILGTNQTLGASPQPFSSGDMALLEANGIIFLANPIPGANALGVRIGKNTSSNAATSEIAYTRKLNQIVRDLNGPVLGQFVNKNQGVTDPDPIRQGITAALNDYFGPQVGAPNYEIANFSVECDLGNNTVSNIQAGVCNVLVVVEFMAVINILNVKITAGQSVTIVSSATPAGS